MRIAVIQLASTREKSENLSKALGLLGGVDADLAVLPEYLMGVGEGGALTRRYVEALAEPLDGPFSTALTEASRDGGLALVYTMYLLEEGRVYNAAVLAERGRVKAVYRKVHLFDAYGYRESEVFAPGPGPVTAEVGGFTAGLAVCFDLRFPELFRVEALRGADLFIVPAAWYSGPHKLAQWRILTAARAHENTAYLVAAGQAAPFFTGHSLVATPYGETILELGEGEAVGYADLEESLVEEARERIPVLRLRRPDAYRGLLG